MRYFPESLVDDASCLEPVLGNEAKDRHVLATAIRAGAPTIVTFNLRDFSSSSLEPWGIQAVHPADYLITLHTIAPDVVVAKLIEMVRDRQPKTPDLPPQAYLFKLARSVPAFAAHLLEGVAGGEDAVAKGRDIVVSLLPGDQGGDQQGAFGQLPSIQQGLDPFRRVFDDVEDESEIDHVRRFVAVRPAHAPGPSRRIRCRVCRQPRPHRAGRPV